MSDVMDLINSAGSGFDTFKFDTIGDTLDGTISGEPRVIDSKPKQDGTVDKLLVIDVHTNDGDDWALMCGPGGRLTALREALQKANASSLEVGARLVMKYTGDAPKRPGQIQAMKLYTAAYQPPAPSKTAVDDLLS
jgi:hypothetical protein